MNRKKAFFFAMAAVLGWSTAATAFKITLKTLNIYEALLLASLVASIVLLTLRFFEKSASPLPPLLYSLKLGLFMPTSYYLVLFQAYALLPAQYALALNYSWPLCMVILAYLYLKETIQKVQICGLILGFLGILVLGFGRGIYPTPNIDDLHGILLALGSAVIWSIYWILMLRSSFDQLSFLTASFLGSIPTLLILNFFYIDLNFPTLEGLLGCLHIGIFEMGLSFFLWSKALELGRGITFISNLAFLSPFLSLIWIFLILHEPIESSAFGGLLLILVSILLVQPKHEG